MKAILGNFTKISETEFRLKKDLQFADISVDESHEIKTVQYQDKQNIQIGDVLTHNDCDYEIKSIDTTNRNYILVKVLVIEQPYVEKPKPKFIARKMSPPKPRPKPIVEEKIEPKQDLPTEIPVVEDILPIDKIDSTNRIPLHETDSMSTPIIPKKKSILKRFISYLGNKLTSYSDS